MIEDRLVEVLSRALEQAAPGLGIDGDLPTPELLAPKRRDHGDFATNVALELAKRAGKPPREVAQAIADALPPAPFLERAEVAGPGFLNLFVTDAWLHDALREIAKGLPADRIMVETDAPYLAPGRHRGKRNEPAFVIEIVEALAETRGVSRDQIAHQTTENFLRLFSKVPRQAAAAA